MTDASTPILSAFPIQLVDPKSSVIVQVEVAFLYQRSGIYCRNLCEKNWYEQEKKHVIKNI